MYKAPIDQVDQYTTYRRCVQRVILHLRSMVGSIPTIATNVLYLAPADGCQHTQHTSTNCGVLWASIRRTPTRMKSVATHKTARTQRGLFVRVLRLNSVLAPSHTQVLHSRFSKLNSQKKEELFSFTKSHVIDPTNRACAQQINRSKRSHSPNTECIRCYSYK